MTRNDDLAPVLEDWFDDGTDVFPDRSIEAILGTVGRTAQRRSWRRPWTSGPAIAPRRVASLLGVAAIVSILVGGAVMTSGRPTRDDGFLVVPTPSAVVPTASAFVGDPVTMRGVTAGRGVAEATGRIVFGIGTGDGPALLAIRPDGSDLREIHAPAVCCVSVSRDGGTVMFSSDYEGEQDVVQFSGGFSEAWTASVMTGPNAGPGVQLYPGAWGGFDFALEGVSQSDPRKDGIYLSLDNGGGMAIGEFVRMTGAPDGARDIPLAFSPDGTQLLFVRDTGISSEMGRLGDLYVIDKGGMSGSGAPGVERYRPQEPRRLNPTDTLVLASEAFGSGASWSPDSRQVAFSAFAMAGDTVTSDSRAYVTDLAAGTAPTPITESTSLKTSARWSPDGEWIAHDVARPSGGTRDVWLSRPDGSETHKVATLTGGACCAVWSPDSKWLLAPGSGADGSGLYVIAADGSQTAGLIAVDDVYAVRTYSWGP